MLFIFFNVSLKKSLSAVCSFNKSVTITESGCPREEYIKTCKDIIIKLTNYYPELNISNEL